VASPRQKRGQPLIFIGFNSSHANHLTSCYSASLISILKSQIMMHRAKNKRLWEITLEKQKIESAQCRSLAPIY
jgi:hypothetical protein